MLLHWLRLFALMANEHPDYAQRIKGILFGQKEYMFSRALIREAGKG